jgi:hypothetical protein
MGAFGLAKSEARVGLLRNWGKASSQAGADTTVFARADASSTFSDRLTFSIPAGILELTYSLNGIMSHGFLGPSDPNTTLRSQVGGSLTILGKTASSGAFREGVSYRSGNSCQAFTVSVGYAPCSKYSDLGRPVYVGNDDWAFHDTRVFQVPFDMAGIQINAVMTTLAEAWAHGAGRVAGVTTDGWSAGGLFVGNARVLTPDGRRIAQGVTIMSESGFDYSQGAATPEPTTAALTLAGVALLMRWRRLS